MAHFRRVKRIVEWVPAEPHLWNYLVHGGPNARAEAVKMGWIKHKEHYYWVAEESVREGAKVRSKHLYSFNQESKPTLEEIKVLDAKERESFIYWYSQSKETNLPRDERWYRQSLKNVKKLDYLLERMMKQSI